MRALAVYVHFPWCLAKCPYCDFVSYASPRREIPHEDYASAVLAELALRRPAFVGHEVRSIFVGGGTPSLWDARQVGRVLDGIASTLTVAADCEVSLECNPSSLDAAHARALATVGIRRFSIGVQSLQQPRLRLLGRLHDAEGALGAIDAALQTGARVSADLLFGVPGQSAEEVEAQLDVLVDRGVTHLSCYSLTIEERTPLAALHAAGRFVPAPEEHVCEAFERIESRLMGKHFRHYEVSNYALPGHECRHNLAYWCGLPYLGLGCAAVGAGPLASRSTRDWIRYRNQVDPQRYMEAARTSGAGHPLEESTEPLDALTRLRERIMLGLRLDEGLDFEAMAEDLQLSAQQLWSPERRTALAKLLAEGKLQQQGSRVFVPRAQRLLTDGIAVRLF